MTEEPLTILDDLPGDRCNLACHLSRQLRRRATIAVRSELFRLAAFDLVDAGIAKVVGDTGQVLYLSFADRTKPTGGAA